MEHIRSRGGKFLTVMPRTRSEDTWFREYQYQNVLAWSEVHREPNPRRKTGPDVVYHAVESPQGCSDGYRVLWYRSSQKQYQDQQSRQQRLDRALARLEAHQTGRRLLRNHADAQNLAERILKEEQVSELLGVEIDTQIEEEYRQEGRGRPGPDTTYRRIEHRTYRIRFVRNEEAIRRQASADGLFPLMTNDATLSLAEALGKYKYQPFVEKRHEQLKNMFAVTPLWLKNVKRISSLLWLYYAVELIGALLERQIRCRMKEEQFASLALYPEGRSSEAPTTALLFNILEGHRRHRLLDEQNEELKRFYDPLPPVAQEVLELLEVNTKAYGIN
jgi:transposase